jgi:hypothetical protein
MYSMYYFEAKLNFISSLPMFTQASNIFLYFSLYEIDHNECLACIILKQIWILFHPYLCSPEPITFFSTYFVWKWSYCMYSMYYFEAKLNFISSPPMFTQASNIFSTFPAWKWSYCLYSMYYFEAKLNFISSLPMFTQASNIFSTFPAWKWSYCVSSMYYFEADLNFISSLPMLTQANNIFPLLFLYENDHIVCLVCIILKQIWILFSSLPMLTQANNIFLYLSCMKMIILSV